MNVTSTTTAGTGETKPLTLADLKHLANILRAPPEPIGEWMRQQGHPPEQWRIILPQNMREDVLCPQLLPHYVAFSPVVSEPVFIPCYKSARPFDSWPT